MTRSEELDSLIALAGDSDRTALIWDENPNMRRTIAAAIHERSLRRTRPFMCVSCDRTNAPTAKERLEVQLFGHERNAFTGAPDARPGILEMANGGTVLIDDVAMLDPVLQWLVFHASEARSTMRLGSTVPMMIDVRFIFATSADLRLLVKAGRFREDFLRKLSLLAICPPAARDLLPR